MSDKKARGFLEFILAHPDDDAARLVFADWLDEQGDSDRAEFIRVQIERARLPEWDARQVRLRLRERELIEQHRLKWIWELPNIDGITWEEFRRGFVATASFSTFTVFRAKASACWTAAPIEAVSFRWPNGLESIDRIAPIAGLRELTIHYMFYAESEVDRFADAPLLSTVRTLNITDGHLGVDGFRRLVVSPHLAKLTALRVPSNSIGNGGVSALFDAASLTSVEELDLSENNSYQRYGEDPVIEAVGLAALAAWPGMSRLRSLKLSSHAVGRDGLRALLRSPRASGLKVLTLRNNGLSGSEMQEFGAARPELQLDVLDLGENVLRDLGTAELASAPCLRELKVLELDRCEIELSGARRLAKASFLGSLRQLNVNHNSFGPEGLFAILEMKPQELHTLQMVNNDIGDEGVSHLAESSASDNLLELNLAQNGLKDRAVRMLAQSNHLRELLILRLNSNRISMQAVAALAGSPLGKRLAVIEEGPCLYDDEIPF